MVQFFRKIRQGLLSENKFTRYLVYAIGEIILVVIGILIALQVANWNEDKKTEIFELKMLSEIKHALENDLEYFESMVERMDLVDSASEVMTAHLVDQSVFIDSLYDKPGDRFYGLTMGTIFQFNPGPYETLKISGINKISNDSLRNYVTYLYDFELPRYEMLVNWEERDYAKQIETLESFLGDVEVIRHDEHFDFNSKFPEDLTQNQDFIKLIDAIRSRAKIVKIRYKGVIQRTNLVINKIDSELKKR